MTTVKFQHFFKSYNQMEGKVHLSSDMSKLFNGEDDLMAWQVKVKLVTRLQKVLDLVNFIPLFLEGVTLDGQNKVVTNYQLEGKNHS